MWILGSSIRDGVRLYLPGLIALALVILLGTDSESLIFLIFGFIAKEVLDAGHVFVTVWRTYFNRTELRRSSTYFYVPVIIFLTFLLWGWLGIPGLTAFVVYATIFHNIRQFYGVSKWYQRLNGKFRVGSDRFLYALTALPFLLFHLRDEPIWNSYYSASDLRRFPNEEYLRLGLFVYVSLVVAWLIYESLVFLKDREWNRIASVGFPALLYGTAFLYGRTAAQIMFPLLVSHGFSYIQLTAVGLQRTTPSSVLKRHSLPIVMLTALFFGVGNYFAEAHVEFDSPQISFVLALYLTPLFCHYVFDALIWRAKHPQAQLIYVSKP